MNSAIIILAAFLLSQNKAEINGSEVRAIKDAYEQNRNAFSKCRFAYTLISYNDQNIDEVFKGDFKNAMTTEAVYEYNGPNAMIDHLYDDAQYDLKARRNGNGIGSSVMSYRTVTNGKLTLREDRHGSSVLPNVSISTGNEEFFRNHEFPIYLGMPETMRADLGAYLKRTIDNPAAAVVTKIDHYATYNGMPVIMIVVDYKDPVHTMTYYVDIKKGCLPVYEMNSSGPVKTTYEDIRFLPGRGWLPYKTNFEVAEKKGRITIIKNVVFENVSPPGKLDFDNPTHLNGRIPGMPLDARKSWSLSGVLEKKPVLKEIEVSAAPILPGETEASPPYIAIGLASLAVLCVSVILSKRYLTKA